jgi:hypothetical protein
MWCAVLTQHELPGGVTGGLLGTQQLWCGGSNDKQAANSRLNNLAAAKRHTHVHLILMKEVTR